MLLHPEDVSAIVNGLKMEQMATSFSCKNPRRINKLQLEPDVNSRCSNTDPETIELAVNLAHDGWFQGNGPTVDTRLSFLRELKLQLTAVKDPWVHICHLSTSLPVEPRLYTVEWNGMMTQIDQAIELLKSGRWRDASIRTEGDFNMALSSSGIGPTLVMGPHNFPLRFSSVVGTHAIMNWVAGNPVLSKPHPALSIADWYAAQAVLKAMEKTGMPKWMFAFLPGEDKKVAEMLTLSDKIAGIFFTGSKKVGQLIREAVGIREYHPRLVMELGAPNVWMVGNSVIQTTDQIAPLAQKIFDSSTMAAGAFCTQADILVIESCANAEALIEALKKLFTNAPAQLCLSSRMAIDFNHQMDRVLEVKGVSSLAKSKAALDPDHAHVHAQLLSVTEEALTKNELVRSEHFGPVVKVIVVDSLERASTFMPKENLVVALEVTDEQLDSSPGLLDRCFRIANRVTLRRPPTGVSPCHEISHGNPHGYGTSSGPRTVENCVHDNCHDGFTYDQLPPHVKQLRN